MATGPASAELTSHIRCPCGYDLFGLRFAAGHITCPECGILHGPRRPRFCASDLFRSMAFWPWAGFAIPSMHWESRLLRAQAPVTALLILSIGTASYTFARLLSSKHDLRTRIPLWIVLSTVAAASLAYVFAPGMSEG